MRGFGFFLKGLLITCALAVFASGSSTSITAPIFTELSRIEKQATILFSDQNLIEQKITPESVETMLVATPFGKLDRTKLSSPELAKLEGDFYLVKAKIENYSQKLGNDLEQTSVLDSLSQTAHQDLVLRYLEVQTFLYGGYVKMAHEDPKGVTALEDQRIDRLNLVLHREIALPLLEHQKNQLKFNLRHRGIKHLELFLNRDNRWQVEFSYLLRELNRGAIYDNLVKYAKTLKSNKNKNYETFSAAIEDTRKGDRILALAENVKDAAKKAEIKLLQGIAVYQSLINRWSLKRIDVQNGLLPEIIPAASCAADLIAFRSPGTRSMDEFPLAHEFAAEDRYRALMKYSYGKESQFKTPKESIKETLAKQALFPSEKQYREFVQNWLISVPGLQVKTLVLAEKKPAEFKSTVDTLIAKLMSYENSELTDIKISDKKDKEGNVETYQKIDKAFESYNLVADDLSPRMIAQRTGEIVYQMRRDALLEALYEWAQAYNPELGQKDFVPQTQQVLDEHLKTVRTQWIATTEKKIKTAIAQWEQSPEIQKTIRQQFFSEYDSRLWTQAPAIQAQSYVNAAHEKLRDKLSDSFWLLPDVKRAYRQKEITQFLSFFMAPDFIGLKAPYQIETIEDWGMFFLKKVSVVAEISSFSAGYQVKWYRDDVKKIRESQAVMTGVTEFLTKAAEVKKREKLQTWELAFMKVAPLRHERFALKNTKEDTRLFKKALTLFGVELHKVKYKTAQYGNEVYQLGKPLNSKSDWKEIKTFEEMPQATKSLGDQRIIAEMKVDQATVKFPIFSIQTENESDSPNFIDRLAAQAPYPKAIGHKAFSSSLKNTLSIARQNHVGLISDFCSADLKKYDEDEKFRKIFLATSKPREVIVSANPDLAYLDQELKKDTRTTMEAIEANAHSWVMVLGGILLLIVAWQFAPMILGFLSANAGALASGFAFEKVCSAGVLLFVKIVFTGAVSITQIVGWTFSLSMLYVNIFEMPPQLKYQMRVANSEIGYTTSDDPVLAPPPEYLLARPAMKTFQKEMRERWFNAVPYVALDSFFFVKFTIPAVKNTLGFKSSQSLKNLSHGVEGSEQIVENIKMPELKRLIQEHGYWGGLKTYSKRYSYALRTLGKVPTVNIYTNTRGEVVGQVKQLLGQKLAHEVKDLEVVRTLLDKKIISLEHEIELLLKKSNEYYAYANKTEKLSLMTKARIFAGNKMLWFLPKSGTGASSEAYRQYIKMVFKPGYIDQLKGGMEGAGWTTSMFRANPSFAEANAFVLWSRAKHLEREVLTEYQAIYARAMGECATCTIGTKPVPTLEQEIATWLQYDKELVLMRKLFVDDAKILAPEQLSTWKGLKQSFKDYDQLTDEALNLGRSYTEAGKQTVGYMDDETTDVAFKVVDPLALPPGLRNQDNYVILDTGN